MNSVTRELYVGQIAHTMGVAVLMLATATAAQQPTFHAQSNVVAEGSR